MRIVRVLYINSLVSVEVSFVTREGRKVTNIGRGQSPVCGDCKSRFPDSVWRRSLIRHTHKCRLPRLVYFCLCLCKNMTPSHKQENEPYGSFSCFVRPEVIETSTYPWQGHVIPLNHGRSAYFSFCNSLRASSIQRFSLRFKRVLPIIVFPTPKCNVGFWLRPWITWFL